MNLGKISPRTNDDATAAKPAFFPAEEPATARIVLSARGMLPERTREPDQTP